MPEKQNPAPPPTLKTQNWGQQIIGAGIGGLLAFFLLQLIGLPSGWQPTNPNSWILLSAAIGAMLNDFDRFDKAGARLTGRDSASNRRIVTLNVAVALLASMLFFAMLVTLIYLANLLIGKWIN